MDLPLWLEPLLARVRGPGQYVGGEVGTVVKPAARLRAALAFPDLYSVGMSHHGLRILYEAGNALAEIACERVFTPAPDFEAELRAAGRKLYTLETFTPLAECDLLGFSLAYELSATNLLTMLDLGGVPLLAAERGEGAPLVLAGGHGTFNPEPFVDFCDAFFIGEADLAWPRILELLVELKAAPRPEKLRRLAAIDGVYVPTLYRTEERDGWVVVPAGQADTPWPVKREFVANLETAPAPRRPVVPVAETAHERTVIEILRGCPHGCRFCQAGLVTRPVRERPVECLLDLAKAGAAATGYDEIGLLSLSSTDHSRFDELVEKLDAEFAPRGVSLSLPSLRVNAALADVPRRFRSVRKSGLTLAPEAGSERLRAAINKNISDADLLAAAEAAFKNGWKAIKLYFMLGLPTETDADVLAIAELARQVAARRSRGGGRGGGAAVTVSVSNFVPKAGTPFQWEAMCAPEELARRQKLLAGAIDRKRIDYKTHDLPTSRLEGVFARGDRRLGRAIRRAWEAGARLDAWSEHFRPALWDQALAAEGIDQAVWIGPRQLGELLPWSHIDCGVSERFLLAEREKSLAGERTPDCGPGQCAGCGAPGCTRAKTAAG